MPAVETRYSTYADGDMSPEGLVRSRDHRAFAGFSMGGVNTWHAFQYCLPYFRWFNPMSGGVTAKIATYIGKLPPLRLLRSCGPLRTEACRARSLSFMYPSVNLMGIGQYNVQIHVLLTIAFSWTSERFANMSGKRLLVVLSCVCALAMSLVGCGQSAEQQAAASKAAFAGTWDLHSMETDGQETSAEQIDTLRSLGLEVLLDLSDDNVATLSMFGELEEGTWEPKTSTTADITLREQTFEMKIAEDQLVWERDDTKLVFTKGEKRDLAAEAAANAEESEEGATTEETSGEAGTTEGTEATSEAAATETAESAETTETASSEAATDESAAASEETATEATAEASSSSSVAEESASSSVETTADESSASASSSSSAAE